MFDDERNRSCYRAVARINILCSKKTCIYFL